MDKIVTIQIPITEKDYKELLEIKGDDSWSVLLSKLKDVMNDEKRYICRK